MKKIILHTKYDLRDYGFIKFNNLYDYENDNYKGSLRIFDTKEEAENYFKLIGIELEIKDEFWNYMKRCFMINNSVSFIFWDSDEGFVVRQPSKIW